MSKIKSRFIHGSIDFFINTDEKTFTQIVIISELALSDLKQYATSLDERYIDEEIIKNLLA